MGEGKQGQVRGGEDGGPHACDVGLSPLLTVYGRAGHRRHLWVPPVDHSQLGEGHKANGSEEATACRGASAGAPRALLWSDPQPPQHTQARKREGPCPLPTQEACFRLHILSCRPRHICQKNIAHLKRASNKSHYRNSAEGGGTGVCMPGAAKGDSGCEVVA